jgi:alkanesulfonate monooxygenase SsuD/methylene tetrahydromethanopterin reductase-like flavin-dependent oxidoreductase (luciferase family)
MAMTVGVSLPSMARGFSRSALVSWCRGIDDGPYTSVSTGERITFFNPELLTTLAAAAVLTERVDVFANLVVAPLHRPAMLAKQLSTIDVLSQGRLVVALGVGGRPHDYQSIGVPFTERHQKVDDLAEQLRLLWSGVPPFDGADQVGPAPVRSNGPKLLSGAMGPRSMERAARWADGITGFSLSGSGDEMEAQADAARSAWSAAGRSDPPWLGSGTFVVLGVPESRSTLQEFGATYLGFFGERTARAIAETLVIDTQEGLVGVLDAAAACGLDEFTLVPGTWDRGCLDAMSEAVSHWMTTQQEAS